MAKPTLRIDPDDGPVLVDGTDRLVLLQRALLGGPSFVKYGVGDAFEIKLVHRKAVVPNVATQVSADGKTVLATESRPPMETLTFDTMKRGPIGITTVEKGQPRSFPNAAVVVFSRPIGGGQWNATVVSLFETSSVGAGRRTEPRELVEA